MKEEEKQQPNPVGDNYRNILNKQHMIKQHHVSNKGIIIFHITLIIIIVKVILFWYMEWYGMQYDNIKSVFVSYQFTMKQYKLGKICYH